MGVGKQLHYFPNLLTRSGVIAAILTLWLLPGPGQVRAAEDAPATTASAESGVHNPFTPYGRQHMLLREALARYQTLADSDMWTPLDAGQPLAPGMRDPRVKQLRSLLMQYGDYPLNDHTDDGHAADEYDERLQTAVRRFQRRHGLKADALVDERTRARLNTSPAKVAQILAANLKRWEELPKELGPRYILINIPDFSLRLIDNGQEEFHMRVVVGKPEHKTPQLATRMTRLEVNPTWRVPRDIALRELLPKGGANLSSSGYQLVNHRGRALPFTKGNIAAIRKGKVMLQQRGGPGNALGRVKFVIPNREAIFLHDTNSKHLFKRGLRAFSHGCIRLEKPLEFARLILAQQNGWSNARIDRILLSDRTQGVALQKPIPVYITYWTAWINREGLLQFRPDIYGLDKRETNDGDPGLEENRQPE